MTLNKTVVNGVPVFWMDSALPLQAHLLFRVGVRDESLVTAGTTHLAEHAVMSSVEERHHDYNATVELTFTSFEASGRPELVTSFLRDVCASISNPDLGRLDVEKKVLAAELSSVVEPTIGEHLLHRYGLESLGLAAVNPPALESIDETAVSRLISGYLTAGNAALALNGPPPPGLELQLPAGDRWAPSPASPLPGLPLPGWFEQGGPHLGLSFNVPASSEAERESATAVTSIACTRARNQLRRERGLIYNIDFRAFDTGSGQATICIETDPRETDADTVREALTRIFDDLAAEGPTQEELTAYQSGFQEYLTDPRSGIDAAIAAAENYLMGHDPVSPAQKLANTQAVTLSGCREALKHFRPTLLVGMPAGTPTQDKQLTLISALDHEAVAGRTFRRSIQGAFQGVPAKARLIIGDAGVSLIDRQTTTVRWEDVRGLERGTEGITLHAVHTVSLELLPSWFSKGSEALQIICDRVGPELSYDAPPK